MDIFYVIILVFMTGIFCVLSFLAGTLSSIGKNKIKLNPIEAYKENKEIKKEIKNQKENYNLKKRQFAVMMENINRYDGTPTGQIDIPNE